MAKGIKDAIRDYTIAMNVYDIDSDNLGGACAIASYTLWRCMRANNYKNVRLVCGVGDHSAHVWLHYKNRAIDITASQYGYKKITFPKDHHHLNIFYDRTYNYDAINDINQFSGCQSPIRCRSFIEEVIKSLTAGTKKDRI